MLMDDMGWGDIGSNGNLHRETPNIGNAKFPVFHEKDCTLPNLS